MHKIQLIFGVLIALLLTPLTQTQAAENESGAGFTIGIQAPDSEESTYVRYQPSAGSSKEISLSITNTSKKDSDFELTVINASTSSTGSIFYSPTSTTINTFQTRLPDLMTPKEQKVTVPADTTKDVKYTINIPESGISGDILGAIYVRKELDKQKSKGMGISNAFAMSMPVHLYGTDQREIMPKLSLKKTKLKKSGTKSVVETNLTNAAARLFGQISIKSQIVNAAGKSIADTNLKNAEMAPSAVMLHTIPVKTSQLTPGKYTVKTQVKSGQKTFDLTDTFTIKADTIKKVATSVNQTPPTNNWWQWAMVGLAAVIVMLIVALIIVARKKKGATS